MADPPSASTAKPPVPRDPRVLTISLHEHPVTLWPGTGLPADAGGPGGRGAGGPGAVGSAVNVALPAGTTDAWLRAFHALVPPLLWRVPQGGTGGAKFTVERMLSTGCDGAAKEMDRQSGTSKSGNCRPAQPCCVGVALDPGGVPYRDGCLLTGRPRWHSQWPVPARVAVCLRSFD